MIKLIVIFFFLKILSKKLFEIPKRHMVIERLLELLNVEMKNSD